METATTKKMKLFDETAQLKGIFEYGVNWEALVAGQASIPPQGARFDISFEGELSGERLKGTIKGVDYLTVRADGRFDMNIFATITTEDGATIAMHEYGPLVPRGDGIVDLHLQMQFQTAHARYAWINTQQARGEGVADQNTGKVQVTAFAD